MEPQYGAYIPVPFVTLATRVKQHKRFAFGTNGLKLYLAERDSKTANIGKPIEDRKWHETDNLDISHYVKPRHETALIVPSLSNDTSKLLQLSHHTIGLVVVTSAVSHFELRQSIRRTWASQEVLDELGGQVSVLFIVGVSTKVEENSKGI